ncbi:MAG TPA: serine--tRNA ligase [Polymorphobacter sp.]|nr:serine--tRNA ligase [Polymorphobacter sp.]
MHDIKAIRAEPAAFDAALARRGIAPVSARLLALDAELRGLQTTQQEALAQRNDASRSIGAAKAAKDEAAAATLMAVVAELKETLPALDEQVRTLGLAMAAALAEIPNLPAVDVPEGADEHGNVVVHSYGTKPEFAYKPLEHDILAVRFGYDPDAAAAIAGARFAVLAGPLARLHRALGQFMIDTQTAQRGYRETVVPLLVRDNALFGTGQLPKFEEDLFKTTDGRYLIPTAEVSLTNLVRESILDAESLPLRLTALTPCFRSEAGSAGRDTRGLIRQHQFEKCELVAIATPDTSAAEHEYMAASAEAILDKLGLHYRRMLLCTGDMGFGAQKTYDLEVWLPGQNAFREISSISNCGDFQARRMDARFKAKGEKGTQFVHTLNGSGLAVGRTLVAVIENYQQADGSVHIPEVLWPYMGGVTRLVPNT